ncbi:MAG: lipid II:glycine glycyltransferase FemX, partial [Dethiobacteria bacterium]
PRFVWRINLKYKLALKKSGRREVEKARKNGVTVKEGKREDLFAFYKLLKETSHRNCFLIRDYYYFLNMWDCLHPSGFLKLYLAVQKDEPLSGALIAPFGEGVWDLYAATSSKAKKIGASYLLTWTLINKFAQENYIFYDLGGLPLREKKNNGLYLFKSRFGGSRVEFIGEYDLINLPTWYYFFQISTRLYEHLKHVRKKLMPIML